MWLFSSVPTIRIITMSPDRPELEDAPYTEGEEAVGVLPGVPTPTDCGSEGAPVIFLEADTVTPAFCF
jgi:hypothetical protein